MTITVDPIRALYDAIAAQTDARPSVRDLPDDDRRAYMREAQRKARARKKEAAASGSPLPTDDAIRAALADAALMILATDAPGAREVLSVLSKAFPGRNGVPSTTQARARAGTLRPTMLISERVSSEH